MWKRYRLCIPESLQRVSCSTVVAHPWVFGLGQEEKSGFYLSPPNAVNYLINRLAGADVSQDVTAILLAAPTLTEFVKQLTEAATVFPLPALNQIKRRAATASSLATTRMQIPATDGGLMPSAPLSASTISKSLNAQSVINAMGAAAIPGNPESITSMLADFASERAALLKEAKEELAQLQAGGVNVWSVSATGNTQTATRLMREEIPEADRVFTLALMFVGEDLAPLRAMLREI
ncbi:hypothetical protein R8O61_001742 [Klebsiella oxytoca]|nr:hypothetical protein [Klebsiella oxytoca]